MSVRWLILSGEELSLGFTIPAGILAQSLQAGPVSCSIFCGSCLMLTRPGYGSAFLTSNWAFRIPIWCQLVSSIIVAVGVFFLPESPRWLVAHDRVDEARAVLAKYHGEGKITSLTFESLDFEADTSKVKRIIPSSISKSPRCTTRFKLMLRTSDGGTTVLCSRRATPALDLFV